jgi:hypothetical protein
MSLHATCTVEPDRVVHTKDEAPARRSQALEPKARQEVHLTLHQGNVQVRSRGEPMACAFASSTRMR